MKKIILLFVLLIIIVSGCLQQKDVMEKEEPVQKIDFDDSKITDKQEIVLPPEPTTNEYKIGDTLLLGSKKVTIKEIKIDSEILIEVDGLIKYISGTRQPIRIEDYELFATEIDISYDRPSTVTLESSKFQLGPNEYLFWFREVKNIAGKTVILEDVYVDDFDTILVSVSDKSNSDTRRIHIGESETMNNLEITNIKNGHRAVSAEKYSILKIKEI